MILIKMGGSVITDKSTPLSFRPHAVSALARAVRDITCGGQSVILVHGGGSFGHHYSVVHDMHTKPYTYDPAGLAAVKNSMVQLNHMILDILLQEGVLPYCCPPDTFVRGSDPVPSRIEQVAQISDSGMCPTSYGDAIWCGTREDAGGVRRSVSYILSGDRIMSMISRAVKPRLAIFATDVDGLYPSLDSGDLIASGRDVAASTPVQDGDVTGGMRRKVEEALRISDNGTDVFFVNGNKPDRIIRAALQGSFQGTLFQGMP